MTKFEHATSKMHEILSSMLKLFVISFINTGILILIVDPQYDIIADGFILSAQWYR